MANTPVPLSRIILRVSILSAIMLAGIFVLLFFLEDRFYGFSQRFGSEIQLGLMLFALWLFVSSGIRSVHRKEPKVPFHSLLLTGMLVAVGAAVLYLGFLAIFPAIAQTGNGSELINSSLKILLFCAGVAFVISLLTAINLKVVSTMLGNVLEFLVVVGLGFALFYFSR